MEPDPMVLQDESNQGVTDGWRSKHTSFNWGLLSWVNDRKLLKQNVWINNHMSLSWQIVKCWGNCSHIPYSLLLGFERSASRWRCASSLQVQSWQSLPLMNSKEKLQRLWSKSWPVRFLDLLIIFHFPTGKSTLLRDSMKGICLCFLLKNNKQSPQQQFGGTGYAWMKLWYTCIICVSKRKWA